MVSDLDFRLEFLIELEVKSSSLKEAYQVGMVDVENAVDRIDSELFVSDLNVAARHCGGAEGTS